MKPMLMPKIKNRQTSIVDVMVAIEFCENHRDRLLVDDAAFIDGLCEVFNGPTVFTDEMGKRLEAIMLRAGI